MPYWHINKKINNWILENILAINFFTFRIFFNHQIAFYLIKSFCKTKVINMKSNQLAILGPWPNVYFHQILDFVLRLVVINKKFNVIYIHEDLKKILESKPFKLIFKKLY